MVHAINALVPSLIPASAPLIADWVLESGLDASYMPMEDAAAMAAGGDYSPRVFGTLAAMEVVEAMQTDGWNYKGATSKTGGDAVSSATSCFPYFSSFGVNFSSFVGQLSKSRVVFSKFRGTFRDLRCTFRNLGVLLLP
jgi:hypothetical protein